MANKVAIPSNAVILLRDFYLEFAELTLQERGLLMTLLSIKSSPLWHRLSKPGSLDRISSLMEEPAEDCIRSLADKKYIIIRDDGSIEIDDLRFVKLQRGSAISKSVRASILARDKACVYCGSATDLHIDHVHPIALGGNHHESNLQVLCRGCNGSKGARVTTFGLANG